MAKAADTERSSSTKHDTDTPTTIEKSVVAFAEQLGRFVGTVQGRAEGWMDRSALSEQVTTVREAAARLLDQLAERSSGSDNEHAAQAPQPERVQKRSRGAVDAPGKKHRRPMPADPRAKSTASQATRTRRTRPTAKTNRGRGRG
jgi:hypothetical protein